MKWRLRSQVGDKVRWYQQPEEERARGLGPGHEREPSVGEPRANAPSLPAELPVDLELPGGRRCSLTGSPTS